MLAIEVLILSINNVEISTFTVETSGKMAR